MDKIIINAFATLDIFRNGNDVDAETLRNCVHVLTYYVESLETYSTMSVQRKAQKDVFGFFNRNIQRKAVKKDINIWSGFGENNGKIKKDFSKRLRWRVMERDGFKCVKCGRSAADGVILEVDHHYPRAHGGMATMENGQTLCFDCNHGKADSIPATHPTQHALDAATAARLPSSFSAEVINPAMGQSATRRAQ